MKKTTTFTRPLFLLILLVSGTAATTLSAQKMLILEKANTAKTNKYFIGDAIVFRLEGEENYWYKRKIKEILPESNCILTDDYLVKISDIAVVKRPPKTAFKIAGGALLSLGITLTYASTVALLYRDRHQNYPVLYSMAGVSFISSKIMLRKRKLHLGEKYRLRAVEIKFN